MSDIKIFACDDSACIFQVNDAALDPRPFYVLSADYSALKEDFDDALEREAALREELNQYEPASPGTASKRARWLLNIQDACKFGLPKHLVHRLNNTAKEIQNSIKFGGTKRLRDENESLQQRLTVAERRAEMLEREFKKLRDVAHGCYQIASSYSGCIDGVEESGGDDHDDPSCAIFHRLYYAMFDADRVLKPAEVGEGS